MNYEQERRIKKWERKFHLSSGNDERGKIMNLQMEYLKPVVIYEVHAKTEKGEPVL